MAVQARGDYVTIYVFDSGPLIDMFRYYYRERFPSLLILKDLWRVNNGVFNGYDLRHSTYLLEIFDPDLR